MATLLLIVIYIAFVGLGIPDSLFGTAWPAIYTELGLPVSAASSVTLLVSGGTVMASLCSARLLHRFGTAAVTAASTCLTAAALLGFSLSNRLGWLCLFAIPLGLGAGAVDTALNHYVSLHYKALHMNFLHCAYGVGVSLSPYLMSFFIRAEGGWRAGYRSAFWIQAAIAMVTVLSLPLWKRAHADDESHVGEEKSKPLGFRALLRLPGVRYAWLMFTGSCAIEYTCGVWGSTFLVSSKGLAVERAAWIVVFYYVGMTLGRFLSGILSVRLSGWRLIFLGQGAILTAIIMLLLPLPPAVAGTGLFFAGLGVGPLFPNLIHLTPANFGREASQSVMGSQMAAAYLGIMLVPPVFGFLAQKIGTWIFPVFLLLLFVILITSTLLLVRALKREGRYAG